MEERCKETFERLATVEQAVKSLHERVDRHDKLIDSIQKMTSEIKFMREDITEVTKKVNTIDVTSEVGHISEKISEIANKVVAIEAKPAKRWESIVGTVLSTIAAALAGGVVGMLLGGGG